jgi:DNA-binding NtrC family response regulator
MNPVSPTLSLTLFRPSPPPPRYPLRAIMVEDSQDDARLLAHELERANFDLTWERVETADTLKDALGRGGWQVVFCDFTMPRFSGHTALQMVRESGLDLPFIYVSGTIGEDLAVEAMKAGAHDYVMKNNLARVAPAVQRALRESELRRQHRRIEAERQRLLLELQAALAEVKRLGGLLHICAQCKSIRDPCGRWLPFEAFIQGYSHVQFSHSLCPECSLRFERDTGLQDKLRE